MAKWSYQAEAGHHALCQRYLPAGCEDDRSEAAYSKDYSRRAIWHLALCHFPQLAARRQTGSQDD